MGIATWWKMVIAPFYSFNVNTTINFPQKYPSFSKSFFILHEQCSVPLLTICIIQGKILFFCTFSFFNSFASRENSKPIDLKTLNFCCMANKHKLKINSDTVNIKTSLKHLRWIGGGRRYLPYYILPMISNQIYTTKCFV